MCTREKKKAASLSYLFGNKVHPLGNKATYGIWTTSKIMLKKFKITFKNLEILWPVIPYPPKDGRLYSVP